MATYIDALEGKHTDGTEYEDNQVKLEREYKKAEIIISDIDLTINGKEVSVEVQRTTENCAGTFDTSYTYIDGDEDLTDEEKDIVDDYLSLNY